MPPGLAEAIAATPEPSIPEDKLERLRYFGKELYELSEEIKDDEKGLKEKKTRAQGMIHKTLPDLMAELRLDNIGLEAENADVVARAYYKANISAEWEEERRNLAFEWLEANGFGALIKNDVTYSFRRGEEDKMAWLMDIVPRAAVKRAEAMAEPARLEGRDVRPEETWDIPTGTLKKNVPHSTLTSMVKTQTELPEGHPDKKVLPLDTLGAVVGRIVEIKPRKKT